MESAKQKFDRLFRALWLKCGRPASVLGTPEFRTLEAQYYKLIRIVPDDFEAFFERFDKWPGTDFFVTEMAEFITSKYPEKKQPPPDPPRAISPKTKAFIRAMSYRIKPLDDYIPENTLFRAMVLKEILGDDLDKFFREVLSKADPMDKIKVRDYIDKNNVLKSIGYKK